MRKITYELIDNFHHMPPIDLNVSEEEDYARGISGPPMALYVVSAYQANRINQHFCGIQGCQCPGGKLYQLDAEGTRWGIRIDLCEDRLGF